MEIKINIDESKFQEVLEKELGAFTQEELHKIIGQAMKEYLNRDDVIKTYLEKNEVDQWGSQIRGSSTMDKLLQNVDLNDILAEPKEKIKRIISEDDTLRNVAIELLANMFKNNFRRSLTEDYTFIEELAGRVAYSLEQMRQR
jgi:hypothetical protein